MKEFFEFLGTNEIVMGISSLVGIIGFLLTICVSIRTKKISKILKYNSVTKEYNRERSKFQKAFEGHRSSILEDNLRTSKLLKDILRDVESYRIKFVEIISLKEKIILFRLIRILKKDALNADFNQVSTFLAILSGRLTKKEDYKNG